MKSMIQSHSAWPVRAAIFVVRHALLMALVVWMGASASADDADGILGANHPFWRNWKPGIEIPRHINGLWVKVDGGYQLSPAVNHDTEIARRIMDRSSYKKRIYTGPNSEWANPPITRYRTSTPSSTPNVRPESGWRTGWASGSGPGYRIDKDFLNHEGWRVLASFGKPSSVSQKDSTWTYEGLKIYDRVSGKDLSKVTFTVRDGRVTAALAH